MGISPKFFEPDYLKLMNTHQQKKYIYLTFLDDHISIENKRMKIKLGILEKYVPHDLERRIVWHRRDVACYVSTEQKPR
jgi:hypothetical protein